MKWNLDRILDAYKKLSDENWDMTSELNWGFTFFADNESILHNIYAELVDNQYKLEFIKYRNDLKIWQLCTTKKEILLADKLHRRNIAFDELAEYMNGEYDGCDVSK
jgi:hypothetical protein